MGCVDDKSACKKVDDIDDIIEEILKKENAPYKMLYRGKCKDGNKWVKGSFLYDPDLNMVDIVGFDYYASENGLEREEFRCRVLPETVGRYTGKIIADQKLFEDDIVEWHEDPDDAWGCPQDVIGRSVVVWDAVNFCWAFKTDGESELQAFSDWDWDNCCIVGNIHDNPELLPN